ncbi:hypothetical protein Z517_10375 [Fonsecaea pedrosoi CBS 271.37]|uniref:Uncharacterized protein n=1 Tax=Fonsecaea pedrosoi CBS 271.37 TaxID=1442368 RepID=A0A0D2G4F7_9EURO|nr:uncharacterized protein Z517_10375 [Fonsecaea pedrosoi CBS 271.37]KIW75633.1 hypothetical protein Z517_10375 [Fonsecaea pedrosoi CBS 271.37]
MSISPYSVQHDFEVQEYNKRRAAWKQSEKVRKQQEKLLRDQAKQARKAALKQLAMAEKDTAKPRKPFGWLSRKSRSKTDVFVAEDKLDVDSDSDEITLHEALGV